MTTRKYHINQHSYLFNLTTSLLVLRIYTSLCIVFGSFGYDTTMEDSEEGKRVKSHPLAPSAFAEGK